MNNGLCTHIGVLAALSLTAIGCVQPAPGRIDPQLLIDYQKAVLSVSPGQRVAETGIGMLRPVPGRISIPLKSFQDKGVGMRVVELSLTQAIGLAMLNSVEVSVVSFDPAISREQMRQAAAAFDYTVFASLSHERTNRRRTSTALASKSREIPFEVGLRNTNVYGGVSQLTWQLSRNSDNIVSTAPDPWHESIALLEYTQPLLRGGGKDFNLAVLRLAELTHETSYQQFRQKVEEVVTQVQTLYWALVQTQQDVRIQEKLLSETTSTLERVRKREGIDATQVIIKQIEAAEASRRAGLYRARKIAVDVQDQLIRFLADRQLGLWSGYLVKPTTAPIASEVKVDVESKLVDALKFNPALEQARLAIQAAEISVRVARNETLPILEFVASVGYQGLRRDGRRAVSEMSSGGYFDHTVGLQFEWPLGNREAKAALRQRRYEKLRSISELQNVADTIALNVREVIRRIGTSYDELRAQQEAVVAGAKHLKALDALEEKQALTPEFLQVKLQAQETLASSAMAVAQALTEFNSALAQLAQITGTTLQANSIKLAAEHVISPMATPRK